MEEKTARDRGKPDPQRMAALRALPVEIKQQLTGEEVRAFLHSEELPDSLLEKLKDYLVDERSSGQDAG
ncbi:MAG: hypothetical protein A2521_07365 [Deltaproteobacteria bacterium RIFOXYD12_FULL_57_12]|nr:MAG: hypothetical protein A2521_07365 [Deltaproteobacteria bacterium RIFOXYD12_FULL_57_12]